MNPKNKLAEMPIRPLLYTMAVPLMLSLLIQSLYNIVDSVFVSRVSEQALTAVHEPTDLAQAEEGIRRLKFDEAFGIQLAMVRRRRENAALLATPRPRRVGGLLDAFDARLPFELTRGQVSIGETIFDELAGSSPMHRLLQGDVGSGKTVVAALSAVACIEAGWQCALMAPTEILAEQHFGKLVGWLEPILAPLGKKVAWLAGAQKKKERAAMLALIQMVCCLGLVLLSQRLSKAVAIGVSHVRGWRDPDDPAAVDPLGLDRWRDHHIQPETDRQQPRPLTNRKERAYKPHRNHHPEQRLDWIFTQPPLRDDQSTNHKPRARHAEQYSPHFHRKQRQSVRIEERHIYAADEIVER